MKRIFVALLALMTVASPLFAQNALFGKAKVDGPLLMDTGVRELASLTASPASLASLQGASLCVFGTMGAVVSRDEETGLALIELLSGAWTSPTTVVLYRVHVRFSPDLFPYDELEAFFAKPEGKRVMLILSKPSLGTSSLGPVVVLDAITLVFLQ